MSDTTIIVYGTTWCGDCRRARRFLQNHQIDYEWINIDQDREAEAYVREVNHGNRSVPTILFPDGSILVEPSNLQLAKKLDIEYSW
jgi:glutaredoxin-like protein